MVASMSAKPTQFSFPLCSSFLRYNSKSYAARYLLCSNIEFAPFCLTGVVSRICARVQTS